MTTLLLAVLSISLFISGYYFGNQMGQTRHIRAKLQHARASQPKR